MKTYLSRISIAPLVAGIVLISACQTSSPNPTAGTDQSADIEALRLVIEHSVVNWNTANLDALLQDNADEFVMMGPGEPARTGLDGLREAWAAYHEGNTDEWLPVIEDIQVSGDLGFVRSSFTTTTTSKTDGSVSVTKGKTIVILKRESDGAWRHIVEIWNRDTPPDLSE